MKKFTVALSFLMLGACSFSDAGDILSSRNIPFKVWQTQEVFNYDRTTGEEFLSESKTITEEKIEKNVVLTTRADGIMVSSKTYRTDFYSVENVKVNKNAIMSSTFSPVRIDKNAEYTAFGETNIDNTRYMLVKKGKDKDILLVNDEGEIYHKIGRMVGNRIAVLDIDFVIEPDDVYMLPSVSTRTEVSEIIDGYELIYNGIKDDNMVFTYNILGDMAMSDEFVFPLNSRIIEINNIRINVLDAGYNKIEYIILGTDVPCKYAL
ncbi:MAG: hypothetical protein E7016_02385 [Alphaproteobacteria bacterium]|nr:hypothetical protein [Alphaproteobacteria bacterium]